MEDISKQKHMKFKEIAAYSLGLFGFQAIVGLLNSYQAEFDGSILGVNVSVVAILILIAKIVSAVADPIVGNLVDRSKSKHGKFKSMIMYSIIPLLVMTAVVFIDVPFKSNTMLTYVWIFITYLIWSIAMTMGDVPSQGIASVLTPNPTERTNVVSISNTFKQVGFSACVVIVPIVCLIIPGGSQVFGFEGDTDTPMIAPEYLGTAILTAVLGCILFALIPLINKERVTNTSAEKTTAKDMINALKNNKPFMLVIISYFLGFGRQMAMGIQVQAATVILGSQNLVAVLGIVTAVGSMISMALCPLLIKKLDEKKAYIILSIYGFAASIFSFVIGHFWFINPTNMVLTVLFYASLFLIGLQFGAVTLMPMIMTADAVDYYEYETGKRMEGACYSILTLTIKVCLALGTAVGLIFVQQSGYYEGLTTGAFKTSTKDIIFFAYTALPGILALLSIIPMFKYDIVGEKKSKISSALAERRKKAE
ncbi:MAG: MFS transporter [Acetobacter sp.]|nr:MFS transporter [Bacteroides sp.]MCM1341168.1 MFS transporter [Acetobacter sp.]MCM1433498.1 MFS transporter [Clostridiales bacterium]